MGALIANVTTFFFCGTTLAIVNRITNTLGILPGVPAMRIFFIVFYLIICSIFIILYYEIFSTALWSSRALKTEAELNIASNIQRDMLPNIFPSFPDRSEFDVYATMDPVKEVCGDFYDFFMIDQTPLAAVIADVSVKGVPAALFMVIAKTIIRNQAQSSLSPSEIFSRANEQLIENNGEGLFGTAYLSILDLPAGVLTYTNAGHNPPLIRQNGGAFELLKIRPGFVLAGMEGMRYKEFQVTLTPGDMLLLYTDGVTEATNATKELYGEKRLEQALNAEEIKNLDPD